jgi:hypothetical protein
MLQGNHKAPAQSGSRHFPQSPRPPLVSKELRGNKFEKPTKKKKKKKKTTKKYIFLSDF